MCLSTEPRWPEGWGGGHLLAKKYFIATDFSLFGAILSVLFRSDSRHSDRVDNLWECATEQAVMTVAQWYRNQIIKGPLVIAKKIVLDGFMLTWCNFKYDGVLFNLDT